MALGERRGSRGLVILVVLGVVVLIAVAVVAGFRGDHSLVAPTGPDGPVSTDEAGTTPTTVATTVPGSTASSSRPGTTRSTPTSGPTTLAPPPTSAGTGVWKFMLTAKDGTSLLRWPCGAIHWAVEPGATAEQEADVTAVVGELAARTGRSFVFDGAGSPDQPVPGQIAVSFDPARVPPGALGYGGPVKAPGLYNFKILYGLVAVVAPRSAERQILRHEFGHVMGLDNVDVSTEVMTARYVPLTGWGPGTDHALGNLGPCYP